MGKSATMKERSHLHLFEPVTKNKVPPLIRMATVALHLVLKGAVLKIKHYL